MTEHDDDDYVPQAEHVQVGRCSNCHGAHIILVSKDGTELAEGVIALDGAESFCNAILQAVGSPMRVRHEH